MSPSKKQIDAQPDDKKSPNQKTSSLARSRPSSSGQSFEAKLRRIDWRDLELFLDISEAGSLRAGAARTGHAVGTIRRRIARIEDKLGELIAKREPLGLQLTPAGEKLAAMAREMRRSHQLLETEHQDAPERDRVRIAVTEGLGTYWLMPRLVEFQAAHPDLDVTLHCDMQRADVAGGDCDVAIQLEPPADKGTLSERIGCLHLMPFASERYLETAGVPSSVDDWPHHRLVWQEADHVASHLLPYFLGVSQMNDLIGIRTNSSSAHFGAILSGGGIGILPTYARAIDRRVKPLDIGIQLRREILCVTAARRRASPAVALAIDWVRASFSSEMFPWFRDQFVHPRDFEETLSSRSVIGLFEGFIDSLAPGEG